ncbi:MAG: hypothetical protein QM661_08770 [Solimonas sp.]
MRIAIAMEVGELIPPVRELEDTERRCSEEGELAAVFVLDYFEYR